MIGFADVLCERVPQVPVSPARTRHVEAVSLRTSRIIFVVGTSSAVPERARRTLNGLSSTRSVSYGL